MLGPGGDPRPSVRPAVAVGVNADFRELSSDGAAGQAGRVAELGVGVVRDDLDWALVEPRPGVRDWRPTDRYVASVVAAGMRPLPIIHNVPAWAGPDPSGLPDDPAPFARYAADAVARYGPGGTFWRERPDLDARLAPTWFEVSNEPWYRPDTSPAAYARLLAAAVPAARRANPRARFLAAVEVVALDGAPWIEGMYAAVPDLNGLFDGVAVHPYGSGDRMFGTPAKRPERFDPMRLDVLRRQLAERGAGDKPAWVTEIGWPTCPASGSCTSLGGQARNLSRFAELVGTRYEGWIEALVVFQITDYSTPADDPEGWFGLLRRDGSRKPAWGVVRDVARGGRTG